MPIGTVPPSRSHDQVSPVPELKVYAGNAELSHHRVEGRPVQSETRRRRRDDSTAFPKYSKYMLPVHLLERRTTGGGHRLRTRAYR